MSDENQEQPGGEAARTEPSAPPIQSNEVHDPQPNSAQCKGHHDERDAYDWMTLGVQVLGLAAVCVYAYFAHGQVRATLEANRLAKESLAAANRAWVLPKEDALSITPARASGSPVWAFLTLVLENYGNSPARDVKPSWTFAGVKPEPVQGLWPQGESPTIPPRQFRKYLIPLTRSEIWARGQSVLIPQVPNAAGGGDIEIRVQYQDQFALIRPDRFCISVSKDSGSQLRATVCPNYVWQGDG